MAKGKGKDSKKNKKKEAEEAARLAAEEEARRLEEERLRLEEEERKQQEAEKAARQKEEGARLALEADALKEERNSLASFMGGRTIALKKIHSTIKHDVEWLRYISCTPLPDPKLESQLNGYLNTLEENSVTALENALTFCQDNELVVREAEQFALAAENFGSPEIKNHHHTYLTKIRTLTANIIDRVTAHILQHADEFQNSKGEVQVQASVPSFKFGLWVNLAKNPRMKTIEIPELNFTSELPKSLALASIAVRMLHCYYDDLTQHAKNEFMTVGGVFTVDLLALPPPPKKVKGWTLRQVTPLATNVSKLPYPIPPAGSDHTMAPTTLSAAAPPPMGLNYPLPEHVVLLESDPQVGWWDSDSETWRTDGISEVKYDEVNHILSFQTVKLMSLGLLISRIKLLPYGNWHMRPTSATTGVLTIMPESNPLPEPIAISVGEGVCTLLSPQREALKELNEEGMPPGVLLHRLSESGIHLLPEDRDAAFCGTTPKDKDVESALCADLALISTTFMLGSSKWNKTATSTDCLVRIAQVTDFDRTEARDVEKLFDKEKENVLTVLRKEKGCVTVPLKNKDEKVDEKLAIQMNPWDSISWEQEECTPLKFSASLLNMLNGMVDQDVFNKIELASPAFTETVHHLMYDLRLFSFG